jgi:hypothetical protein
MKFAQGGTPAVVIVLDNVGWGTFPTLRSARTFKVTGKK